MCDVCKVREAEIYQPHTGRRLCRQCFIEDIRERVRKEADVIGLNKARKILLAVSGGKDSFALADTLASFIDHNKLIAMNIVEGIHGYNRAELVLELKKFLNELGIELIETSFKEKEGATLDEMVEKSKQAGLNVSACTFCGGFRRKIINEIARDVNADLVATGHNLDDEAQTIMINLIRGDLIRLIRFGDVPIKLSNRFVLRVKPLRKIYEWETTMYAYYKGYSFQEVECPYITQRPTLRAKVRDLLYLVESIRPGSLLKIIEEFDKVAEEYRKLYVAKFNRELPTCKICGEPTSYGREICKNCELLLKIGLLKVDQKYLPIS